MRSSIMMLAAATLAMPGAAFAEGCPNEVGGEFEATLGETAGWLETGQTVHTPAGLTMFGAPVSYVVVKRETEGGAITEVDYRFQDVNRASGQEYPDSLRKSFDKEFNTSGCAKSRDPVCTVAFQSSGGGEGRISGGKLSMGDLWVPDDARGPAVPMVQQDVDAKNGDPVYLVCLY